MNIAASQRDPKRSPGHVFWTNFRGEFEKNGRNVRHLSASGGVAVPEGVCLIIVDVYLLGDMKPVDNCQSSECFTRLFC